MVATYDKLRVKHGEASAAATMRVWRLLLSYSMDIGWRKDNPAKGMRLRSIPSRTQRWTEEQVEKFSASATAAGFPSLGLAVEIAYDIGQRQGDVLALSWAQWDGSAFAIQQSKTGQPVCVPIHRDSLRDRLNTLRTEIDQNTAPSSRILVCESTHKPWKVDHFKHAFAEVRSKAGLPQEIQFRDLRRTAGTEWGDAGATDDELRGAGGWKSRNVVAVYVKPTGSQAANAQAKRRAAKDVRGKGIEKI